jgi:TPR repeat protein
MDKKAAVREAILSVTKENLELKGKNTYPVGVVLPGQSSPKQHRTALATFAQGCAPEDEVVLFDSTIMSSGKKGALFSTNAVYATESDLPNVSMPLFYDELAYVETDGDKFRRLILHYRDGRTIRSFTGIYTCYFCAVLNAALQAIKVEPSPGPVSGHTPESEPEVVSVSEPQTASAQGLEPVSEALFSVSEMMDQARACSDRKDFAGALHWYERAAREGCAEALYRCGAMYAEGQGTKQDLARSFAWVEKAAALDHEEAKTVIRQIKAIFVSAQVAQNPDSAPKTVVVQKAGSVQETAGERKPELEAVGEEKTEPTKKEAEGPKPEPSQEKAEEPKPEPSQEKAGEQKLSSDEQYARGMELYRNGDYDAAFSLLKKICRVTGLLKLKYPEGQAAVGWMLENGLGTEVNEKIAYIHYRIAAQRGSRDGMAGMVRLSAVKKDAPAAEYQTALEYARQLDTREASSAIPVLEQKLAGARKREEEKAERKKAEEEQERLFQGGVDAYKEKDYERSVSCFIQAAGLGSITAMSNLGIIYRQENTGIQDLEKAFEWTRKAAEQGDVDAQFACGKMYNKGEGTEADKARALYWYEKAAEQGEAFAQYDCGKMYLEGKGTKKDRTRALYWYEKAAEQGHGRSARDIALYFCNAASDNEKEWFLKAAEAGDAYSQVYVGEAYDRGGRGFPQDQEESFRWMLKAAEQGVAEAQYNCGIDYMRGEGTNKDETRALYWYEKAAEQGYAEAQYACGVSYDFGEGTNKDETRALYWYEKAAEQGHAKAQYACGVSYFNGDGVARNKSRAWTWFERAAKQTGDREVQEKAKKILRERF